MYAGAEPIEKLAPGLVTVSVPYPTVIGDLRLLNAVPSADVAALLRLLALFIAESIMVVAILIRRPSVSALHVP